MGEYVPTRHCRRTVRIRQRFLHNFVFDKSLQSIVDAVNWSCGGVDARSFCGKVAHVGDGERNISPKFRSNSRRDAWCKVISR